MAQSSIEWTEMTWNPTTGCSKVSAGCKFCYAEVMTRRLQAMGIDKYKDGFKVRVHEDALNVPYTWKGSRVVFVNSMSDLFHPDVPLEFIQKVFKVMNDTPQHTYQILTKRADILLKYNKNLNWSHNIWMGVSVENEKVKHRIDFLRETNARVKFLSCEPLIGPLLNMNLDKIDWVIVGGESGRKPRPMDVDWVLDIQEQCEKKNVAFFFKQWGGINKKKTGRSLNGKFYDDIPLEEIKEADVDISKINLMNKENLYFIALIPKRELREKINAFKNDFANRFNSRKSLKVYPHITLKAPFKCSADKHAELVNWFSNLSIDQNPVSIQLKNFEAFHNRNNPAVYVNPVITEELQFLQKQIIAGFSNLFPQDIHPVDIKFKPHITVAYRDLTPEMFSKAWEEYKSKSFNAIFEVDAFYLLQHDTRKWNIIATKSLSQEVVSL